MLAGQHYKYLLRQITDIADGRRRNANPDMVKIVKEVSATRTCSAVVGLHVAPRMARAPPAK